MNFQGEGRPLSAAGMDRIRGDLGAAEAEVWALLTVETRGFGFLPDRRPQILFERHVFHRLTQGRYDAAHADLSHAKPGGYAGDAAEYTRLEPALGLDRQAALASASWGIGQVMGCNYKSAGFAGIDAMVAAMLKSEDAQLLAMANFVKDRQLDRALQRHDWASFARGYNGADFEQNAYHTRLAAAYAKCTVMLPDLALRRAQAALLYLGIVLGPVDGLRGRRTRSALMQFQSRSGLPETGELDPGTEGRLLAAAFAD